MTEHDGLRSEHETLCDQVRGGSSPALEVLIERHLPCLEAYVELKAGPAVRARESLSDLVQSVCVEMLRTDRFEYQGESRFVHWMCRQALHKIINKNRFHHAEKRDLARELPLDAEGAQSGSFAAGLVGALCTPSRAAMAREQVEAIEAAIDALPEDYREAVILSRLVGLGHADIAEEMGRSAGAVRNLVHRGVARLSTVLDRVLGDDASQ